jgi:hypothetical protein
MVLGRGKSVVFGQFSKKNESAAIYKVLLDFVEFNSRDRARFLSAVNDFLVLSSQAQKQLVTEWEQQVVETEVKESSLKNSRE